MNPETLFIVYESLLFRGLFLQQKKAGVFYLSLFPATELESRRGNLIVKGFFVFNMAKQNVHVHFWTNFFMPE